MNSGQQWRFPASDASVLPGGRIEIPLPGPLHYDTGLGGGVMRWGGVVAGPVLGDLSSLSAVAGERPALRYFEISHQPDAAFGGVLRRITVRTTTDETEHPDVAGPELSDVWEGSAVAIRVKAPTLPDLVIPGPSSSSGVTTTDSDEPYLWHLAASGDADAYTNGIRVGVLGWFLDVATLSATQRASMRVVFDDGASTTLAGARMSWPLASGDYAQINSRRGADPTFRVAVVDTGVLGADLAGAQFAPVPIDVRSVRRVTLNGTREDLGDGKAWRFDRARQKLIQDPGATALTRRMRSLWTTRRRRSSRRLTRRRP